MLVALMINAKYLDPGTEFFLYFYVNTISLNREFFLSEKSWESLYFFTK